MVWVAPNLRARSSLAASFSRPVTMISPAPRLSRGEDGGQPALAGAEHDQGVADLKFRHLHRPAIASAERVEHHGDFRRQALVDLVHEGIRMQVHVLGIGAPQPRAVIERDVGINLPVLAKMIKPHPAGHAEPAGEHGLHHDPVAHVHAPAPGCVVADLGDDAQRFVPRDDRHRGAQLPFVLFVVAAADAAGFHLQERGIRVDIGQRNVPGLDLTDPCLHHRHRLFRQHFLSLVSF